MGAVGLFKDFPRSRLRLDSQGIFKAHCMMGTAPGFVPETFDLDFVDKLFLVSEEEVFSACRQIVRKEGILVGITSGAAAHAAAILASYPQYRGKMIVCVFTDTGQRYLSVDGLFEV